QVLLTQHDIVQRSRYVNARNTLERLLELGAIPIVNENDTVAVEEIRYGDNDRIAALVANIVRADLLVLLSDVEGVFTSHPGSPGASLLTTIEEITPDLLRSASRGRSQLGSGGMASKLEAARIASLSGVAVVIAFGERPDGLLDVWSGAEVGTYFPARRPRLAPRHLLERRVVMTLKTPENQAIVIFGATGDLTGRKLMPALYNLFVQSLLPKEFAVIGYSRSEMTGDEFREASAAHVAKYSRT